MAIKDGKRRLSSTKPLTRENMIKDIRDMFLLSNRVKGNQHAFLWEDWMYFFIQVILGENSYIDWVKIIYRKT